MLDSVLCVTFSAGVKNKNAEHGSVSRSGKIIGIKTDKFQFNRKVLKKAYTIFFRL